MGVALFVPFTRPMPYERWSLGMVFMPPSVHHCLPSTIFADGEWHTEKYTAALMLKLMVLRVKIVWRL